MKWIITRIDEADFGCEERMPGEPQRVLVSIESEDGRELQFEVAEPWLLSQELDEGDEWPEDVDSEDAMDKTASRQAEFMDRYLNDVEGLDD